MTAPNPSRIDYAPPPRSPRRWRRWFFVAALIASAGSAFWWGPPASRHVQVLRRQRQCANFTRPADFIVYDDDVLRSRQLLSDSRFVRLSPVLAAVGYTVPEWDGLYRVVSPPGKSPSATAFLHERRSAGGLRRIVAVDVHLPRLTSRFQLTARSVRPGSPVSTPSLHSETVSWAPPERSCTGPIRLFAGQPDASDPSHFTIEFDDAGHRGILDGWLRDDGTVHLEYRRPPI